MIRIILVSGLRHISAPALDNPQDCEQRVDKVDGNVGLYERCCKSSEAPRVSDKRSGYWGLPLATPRPVLPSTMSSESPSGTSKTAPPSSKFKSMLDAALVQYKKKTGNDLLALWLASELQTCKSVDSVLDVLRDQAKAFERSDSSEDQKLMKSIDPLVNVLSIFSDALGAGVSLVLESLQFMTCKT